MTAIRSKKKRPLHVIRWSHGGDTGIRTHRRIIQDERGDTTETTRPVTFPSRALAERAAAKLRERFPETSYQVEEQASE